MIVFQQQGDQELVPTETTSEEPSDSTPESPVRKWVYRCVILLAGVAALTALLPLLPVDWWWVRIGDFPRVQLLFAYVVLLLALIPFWHKTAAKTGIFLLTISCCIQLFWIFPYLPFAPHEVEWAESADPQTPLRIMTANVYQENQNAEAVLSLIEQEQPDIVVLCEVNARWIRDLKSLEKSYGWQLKHPLENTYGIAVYSRLPLESARIRSMIKQEIPSIDARVKLPSGHIVRLFAVHPNPPRPGEDTTKRDAELVLVGREVRDSPSAIVLGDLNDVGWSRTTNLFQEVSGLLDPRKGRGLYPTFDATSSIWRYPLDYLFHSDDFRVVKLGTLPSIGSDHFPLLVELSHESEAADTQEGPHLDAGDQEDASDAVESARQLKDNPEGG
ncbi:endonuclease/exonuclease/phosphatase [Gimesia chilikensis]|nr:endonuclease/exonuclease/phosphatase [Gimesia chilikensis]